MPSLLFHGHLLLVSKVYPVPSEDFPPSAENPNIAHSVGFEHSRVRCNVPNQMSSGSKHAEERGSLEYPLFPSMVIPLSNHSGPLSNDLSRAPDGNFLRRPASTQW